MICEHCFRRKATIVVTHVIHNEKRQLSVCENCVQELGLQQQMTNLPQIFTGLVLDIMKYKEKQSGLPLRHAESRQCPSCGYSWKEFRRTGLLGCDKCYDTFYVSIKKLLKEIHGNDKHIGNRPNGEKNDDVDQNVTLLEQGMREAIEKEEYEKAAAYRDRIQQIKKQAEE